MDEPPFLLDAARVVEFAILDSRRFPQGFSAVVDGVSLGPHNVSRVAVVENVVDERIFVLHCNDRWETLAAEGFPDRRAAERSVDEAYAPGAAIWTPYRDLTPEEAREIETTRRFLRQIAQEP